MEQIKKYKYNVGDLVQVFHSFKENNLDVLSIAQLSNTQWFMIKPAIILTGYSYCNDIFYHVVLLDKNPSQQRSYHNSRVGKINENLLKYFRNKII